ncbi:hypothetical protein DSCW_01850 [Desulfosarcina widdelii]|uniref:HTH cro/C1-type domain-containing protein n=1 Tax=Desulfosarcina widdelii TaxID=947919 RepID=A0A5K7YVW0_9BACT|nr:helix-turn-helix transcriptional regulator [Desulfosarcina widdelii]BBO72768.1 hypothetical protein DSCW_01850 [Desulfosarcina widdelii]
MHFNTSLLVAIKEKGWTQKEFSAIAGDHPTFVSRVINGWINLDDARKAKYAKVLDCEVGDLFD